MEHILWFEIQNSERSVSYNPSCIMGASQAVWCGIPLLSLLLTICAAIRCGSTGIIKKLCLVDLACRNLWTQSKTTNPVTICHCRQVSATHATSL